MRPIRVFSSPWTDDRHIYLMADPGHHGYGLAVNVEIAEKLVLVCGPSRKDELNRIVNLMAIDPIPAPDGMEWKRIMEMWLEVPVG
jgi:hypothetical protein